MWAPDGALLELLNNSCWRLVDDLHGMFDAADGHHRIYGPQTRDVWTMFFFVPKSIIPRVFGYKI